MNDSYEKRVGLIARALGSIADSPLGFLLGMALFGVAFVAIPQLALKWDGHLYDRKGCVELQEIQGKIFKVDTCTGDVEELIKTELNSKKPEETKKDKDK